MRLSLYSVLVCLCLWEAAASAQVAAPAQGPETAPPKATEATPPVPSGAPRPPREVASPVNNGMGFSVEPIYWITKTYPEVRQGATFNSPNPGNLEYPSTPNHAVGGQVSIPIGTNGTLRGSFVQMKSAGGVISPIDLTLFGTKINNSDIVGVGYKIEAFKISYDYLTYFWKKKRSEVRLKTLWEVQRISVSSNLDDFVPNPDGTVTDNPAQGTKSTFAPTFGLGLEQTFSRHFRWEGRASGWALPHRSVIGDLEGDLAFRAGHFELLVGGRYLHFKTSPKGEQFVRGTISGPLISLRYYFKKQ